MFKENKIIALARTENREPVKLVALKILLFMLIPQVLVSSVLSVLTTIVDINLQGDYEMIFLLFATGLSIFTVISYMRYVEQRSMVSLGFTDNPLPQYLGGALTGIAMIGVIFLLCLGLGIIDARSQWETVNWMIFGLYAVGYMIQGMSEEVLLRSYGMTQWAIENKHQVIYAIYMNAIIFAGLHLFNDGISVIGFLNILLFGILASLVYYVSENIWFISALHSFWNFAQGLIFGSSVSGMSNQSSLITLVGKDGFDWLHGGAFGFEGGLLCTVVLIIGLFISYRLIKNKGMLLRTGASDEPIHINDI